MDRNKIYEFFRFGIVGVLATIIHFGTYWILINSIVIENKFWTNVVYSIGYVISFVFNYLLSAKFTFRETMSLKNGVGFLLSHIVNYILHILIFNIVLKLGLPNDLAPIPVYMVVIPINFILVRFVFKKIK